MNTLLTKPNDTVDWPKRTKQWGHSDIRALAYPFVYPVFKEIVHVLHLMQ